MLMEVVEEAFSAPIILAGVWACGESEPPDIEGITRQEITPQTQARRKHFEQIAFNMAGTPV